ncbi:hypothetical protein BUALT_Bualt14G0118100 [Buddleja alternifolia]|uniref:Uncharacterized protein n=1 Tax=Buddleja alternifolia TaxID=168488 RepID=A0AAV6WK21_9LAMI|nr:hypothetical protein BUALT_Bualt14G0118100 [Buddleja alternifolia]
MLLAFLFLIFGLTVLVSESKVMDTTNEQLERKLNEVEEFYSSSNTKQPNSPKGGSTVKNKDRERFLRSFTKRRQDAARRELAAAERMQELTRQFETILHQITRHKWAGPFMQPVDVVGLGLHDYYEVIEKPMDFSTIKSKMRAKDATGYKNVREICEDVRLIFRNAMRYNVERDDVHVMARSLLDRFERKWLQLLPKVDEEVMDTMNGPVLNVSSVGPQEAIGNVSQVESLNQSVDEIFLKVDQMESLVSSNTKQPNGPKGGSSVKDKDREKILASLKKRQQDAARRETAAVKRMQELMRQFGTIFRQIIQHKWAGPFMQPVDVVGLGLHDYYEVIEKPMDFSTIKSKMEAKDATGYKNVREICADVRLIFKNAMKYNDERDDVHVMAKSLLEKFETKWLQLLPKVDDEIFVLKEKRRKEEEAEMALEIQLTQEVAHAKMAKDLSSELDEVDKNLADLREVVLHKCRKMSTEEKKRLGSAITRLSPEEINKALEIVAQSDPNFQSAGETSESTLWKLKFFVKDTLQAQMKSSPSTGGNTNGENNQNSNNRRKREICDALAKTSQKKSKKLPA